MVLENRSDPKESYSLKPRGMGVPSGGSMYRPEELPLIIEALSEVDEEIAQRRRTFENDRQRGTREKPSWES